MYTALSILFFFSALSAVYGQSVNAVAGSGYDPNTATWRAFSAVSSSDGWIISGVKAKVADQTATVDAARFAVGNGGGQNAPGFYLGVLAATATVDTTSNVWAGKIAGTFAEVMAGFNTILAYYEGNNQPGFQYALGSDPTAGCATSTNTADCIFLGDIIELKTLSWSSVNHVVTPCTTVDANCKVHSFYMTGTRGLAGPQVVQLNFTVTTHPVRVTNAGGFSVEINPDKGKIDIDIMYPWATKTANNRTDKPHVALIVYAAGKSGSGAAAVAVSRTVSWTSATGKITSFDWDANAKVDGTSQGVYVNRITGTQVTNFPQANAVGIVGGSFLAALKVYVAIFNAAQWATEMLIFSWPADQPQVVSWDPAIGSSPSGSAALGFSLALMLIALMYHRLF